jgi:tRNA G18 (ribose-2'-O)-methylase SpoU
MFKDKIKDPNIYVDYESCEKISSKRIISKFNKEIEKSKVAPLGESNLIVVLDNLRGEYNLPRIIRTAHMFSVREVFVVGTKFFNPYPSVGALRHTRIRMLDTMDEAIKILKKVNYKIYALEPPIYKGKSLVSLDFTKNHSAFLVGNELKGFSINIKEYPFITSTYIPQKGKVESMNVSVAASIALYEWARQQKDVLIDKDL